MPLFESSYKAAAKTEIERKVREIEHRDTVSQKKIDIGEAAAIATTNIDFSLRIKLITAQDAEKYRKRIVAALQADELQRTQTGDMVDGYTNPHEQAQNHYTLEEMQARISREQAEAAAQRATETERTPPPKSRGDEPEREAPH